MMSGHTERPDQHNLIATFGASRSRDGTQRNMRLEGRVLNHYNFESS